MAQSHRVTTSLATSLSESLVKTELQARSNRYRWASSKTLPHLMATLPQRDLNSRLLKAWWCLGRSHSMRLAASSRIDWRASAPRSSAASKRLRRRRTQVRLDSMRTSSRTMMSQMTIALKKRTKTVPDSWETKKIRANWLTWSL